MGGITFWQLISSIFNWLIQNWYVLFIPFIVVAIVCSFPFWKDKIDEEEK